MSNLEENIVENTTDENEVSLASNQKLNKQEKSLGDYLKSLREKNNFSVKQVSIETKISETIINNLENNNFNSLPRLVFLKGFVNLIIL